MTRIRDKIGVCLQPDTRGPIAQPGKVVEAMRYLGLNTIRIRAPIVGADSWPRIYRPLARARVNDRPIEFILTHWGRRAVEDEVRDLVEFDRLYPGQIIAYEGPNEPDIHPVTFNGVTDRRREKGVTPTFDAALAQTKFMRDELRRQPQLNDVLMVPFNDWRQREQRPFTSVANTHIYPRGKTLADSAKLITNLVGQHGRGGLFITEWGYTTGIGGSFTEVLPERVAANVAKDIAFILERKDVRKACYYTLVSSPGNGEQENFGLFRADWTPTPAAEAIRAMTA